MRRIQALDDLAKIESRYESALSKIFREQGRLMAAELEKMRDQFAEAPRESAWGPAWDRSAAATADGFAVVSDRAHEESLDKGAHRFIDDLGLDLAFSLKNPRAVQWLSEHAGEKLAADVSATTRSYIRTLMTEAVDKGWSYDKTARMLKERFAQFAVGQPQAHIDSRAHLIAVTESRMGYEQGNALMANDLVEQGIPMEKAWLTVGDDRVDEEQCGPNEDEGFIPLDQDFQDGSAEPPAHPACRCTALYQVATVEGVS